MRDDLGGLTLSDSPVVFLEAGNMRNGADLELLKSAEFQQVIGEAIVAALVDFSASRSRGQQAAEKILVTEMVTAVRSAIPSSMGVDDMWTRRNRPIRGGFVAFLGS